jgi:PAS domain S-box-containing protein
VEKKAGIRSLLLMLVVIAVLPSLAMVVYGYGSARREAIEQGRQQIRAVGTLAAENEAQLVDGVRQILSTVVSAPAVRREDLRELCSEFLRNVAQTTPGYGTIGVVNLDGDVRCHGHTSQAALNVADRPYFRHAMRDQRFSVGEYMVGRITGSKQLGFAMPIFGHAGDLVGVAFTTVDLGPASTKLRALGLPGSMQVDVADARGTVLASTRKDVDLIGTQLESPALRAALGGGELGSLELRDTEGTDWFYELMPVEGTESARLFVIAGGQRDAILQPATQRFQQQLAVLLLTILLGLALAWHMAVRHVAHPVSSLLERIQDAARNRPVARTRLVTTSREFADLDSGLTSMLQQMGKYQSQLLKAQQITRVGFHQLDIVSGHYTASDTFYELLGRDPAGEPLTMAQYQACIHPADKARIDQLREVMVATGQPVRVQYRLVRTGGQVRWVDVFAFAERDDNGKPIAYGGVLQDITEQHRLRRLYLVQSKINEAVVSMASPYVLIERVCQIAVEQGELRMVWIATLDPEQKTLVPLVSAGHDDGFTELVGRLGFDAESATTVAATALHTRTLTVSNDLANDPRMALWSKGALRRGYKAVAAVPISPPGQNTLVLVLMADETQHFQEEECRLLAAIGESVSSALEHLRKEAERRAREERLMLLEASVSRLNDIVLITEAAFDADGPRILFVNEAFERITGYSAAEAIGQTPRMLQGPKTQRDALARIRQSLADWTPVGEELINYTRDGREFWLEMEIVPVADDQGRYTHWVAVGRDITGRKLAQQKEAQLRGGFELLFLGNPHPMWVFDVQTRAFLEVNHAAMEQYGYSHDEFMAMSIEDIRPASERERLRDLIRRSTEGRHRSGTWIHLRKDGSLVSVDITAQRISYNGRDAELVVAVDLTERVALEHQREQALLAVQESQAKLARAQSLARLGSWERFVDDRPAVWSAGLYEITQRDPALGPPDIEESMPTVHPEDLPDYLKAMRACFSDGVVGRLLYRCPLPDGRTRWLEENIDAPVRDASGQIISVSGTVQDVTERIEFESHLQRQLSRTQLLNHIARATDERLDLARVFRVVCDNLESQFSVQFAAVLLYDAVSASFKLVHLGPAAGGRGAAFGLLEGAVLPEDEAGLSRCVLGELVYEPDLAHAGFELPCRLARAGLGSVVFAPLQAQGQVIGVLVAARDASKAFTTGECEFMRQLAEHVALAASQARLHLSLQEAYDELREAQQAAMQQERLRVLGQMASGIAHDINNAISPVALYTESLLARETGLSERGRAQLQTVQLAIDDVAGTVARMREFYRPSDSPAQRQPVELNQLVRQVLELTRARWRDMAQEEGISVDVQLAFGEPLPPVLAFEGEIRDAVTNLVLNAVDAMPQGGTLSLGTKAVVLDGGMAGVQLTVTDTGIGMDEDTRRRCLEPFFSTKGQRGSGLGLAMVYGAMQRHGAQITIDSAPGQGTTIRLIFPAG